MKVDTDHRDLPTSHETNILRYFGDFSGDFNRNFVSHFESPVQTAGDFRSDFTGT